MTVEASSRLEMEELARKAIIELSQNLNDQIDQMDWFARDQAFWAAMGQTEHAAYTVEKIPLENFYVGHVPSLIEAPIEKYPNCAAYCFRATPTASADDIGEMYDIRMAVEVMCKGVESEEEVNSRVQRTVEAAHAVLCDPHARWLGGFAWAQLNNTPTITVGDLFVRRYEKSRGDRWYWQGGRLEYSISRYISY